MNNTENRLITAVITTYKREENMIRRAIESVLSQTYSPIELIIVDDNRDDSEGQRFSQIVEAVVESLKDGNSIFLYKTEQGKHGAQAARNTGIHKGKGDYFAFLDDDDEWLPNKIKKQVELMLQRPDLGMCYCKGRRLNESFKPPVVGEYHGEFIKEVSYRELLRGDSIGSTSQAMISRKAIDKVGAFDETLPARQDYEMWIRISRDFAVAGIDEPLFVYHMNNGAEQVSKNWDNCIKGHTLLYNKYKSDIDKDRRSRFNVVFFLAHYYMRKGDKKTFIKLYAKAFFISPIEFWKKGVIKLRQLTDRSQQRV